MSPMAPWPAWARSIRHVAAAFSSAQREPSQRSARWKTRPSAPSVTREWSSCIAAAKRQLKHVIPTRPARRAASIIASASARVIASGFSQSTWAPDARARTAIARCRWGGVAMTTSSGFARSSISSQRSKTCGTP